MPRQDWNDTDTVTVCCVHGDNTPLPTAEVYIEVLNQSYLMKVGIAETLPYPILLGTDMPMLSELLQDIEWWWGSDKGSVKAGSTKNTRSRCR